MLAQLTHAAVARRQLPGPDGPEGGLRHAVTHQHAQAEALFEGPMLRLGERERRVASSDRVIAIARPGSGFEQDVQHRSDRVDLGRTEALGIAPEARGRELGQEREAGAGAERAQCGVGLGVDVEERQRSQQSVPRVEPEPGGEGLCGQDVAPVRLGHGLGGSRGARRGDQHRDIVGTHHDRGCIASRADELGGARDPGRRCELRERGLGQRPVLVGDHQPRRREPQEPGDFPRPERRVDEARDGAEAIDGEPVEDRVGLVPQEECDAIASRHAALREPHHRSIDRVGDVTERPRVALVEEPRGGRPLGCPPREELRDGFRERRH